MGGSLLHGQEPRVLLRPHLEGRAPTYDSRRRSVYLPVVRNHLYDVFQLFDFSDAERDQRRPGDDDRGPAGPVHDEQRPGRSRRPRRPGRRPARAARGSTTPAGSAGSTSRAYGRPPTAAGDGAGRGVPRPVRRQARGRAEPTRASAAACAWQALCQAILASNEFVYIRVTEGRDHGPLRLPGLTSRRRMLRRLRGGLRLPGPGRAAGRGVAGRRAGRRAGGPARAPAAALPGPGQAGHLPVHEGRPVARRYVRLQAAAPARRRQAAARSPSRASSSPRPATLLALALEVPAVRPERDRGQRAVPARRRLRRRPLLHQLAARHQRRPTAGRCSSCTPAATTSSGPAWARGSPTAWAPRTANLPGFITICPTLAHGGVQQLGLGLPAGRLPGDAARQRQRPRRPGPRPLHRERAGSRAELQRLQLDLLAGAEPRPPGSAPARTRRSKAGIESFELAFRMQTAMPGDRRTSPASRPATLQALRPRRPGDRELRPPVPAGPPVRRARRAVRPGHAQRLVRAVGPARQPARRATRRTPARSTGRSPACSRT